jgi:hypothetical protein
VRRLPVTKLDGMEGNLSATRSLPTSLPSSSPETRVLHADLITRGRARPAHQPGPSPLLRLLLVFNFPAAASGLLRHALVLPVSFRFFFSLHRRLCASLPLFRFLPEVLSGSAMDSLLSLQAPLRFGVLIRDPAPTPSPSYAASRTSPPWQCTASSTSPIGRRRYVLLYILVSLR